MTPEKFLDYAIIGSERYHVYLKSKGKAKSLSTVQGKEYNQDGSYDLWLDKKLYDENNVDIIVDKIKCNEFNLRIKKYNKKRNVLTVVPSPEYESTFRKANEILIESSLLFLIKRTEEWYQKRKSKNWIPSLPRYSDKITNIYVSSKDGRIPSLEQRKSVESVLTNPFTYVWGAPGTGKTRFVLSQCVLNYIKIEKKVIITAPTNVALEQTLFGVLDVLEAEGISEDHVLRLGTPSDTFCNQYAMCCEVAGVEEKHKDLIDEKKRFEDRLKKHNDLSAVADSLQSVISMFEPLKETIRVEQKKHDTYERNLGTLFNERQKKNDTQSELSEKIFAQTTKTDQLKRQRKQFKFIFCELFKLSYYKETEFIFLSESDTLCKLQSEYASVTEALKQLDLEIKNIKICSDNHDIEHTSFASLINCAFSSGLLTPDERTTFLHSNTFGNELLEDVSALFSRFSIQLDDTKAAISVNYPGSKSELLFELDAINLELSKLSSLSVDMRIKKASVVAMTTDTFLSRYQVLEDNDIKIAHAFIDEAGYCSLIKGIPVLSLDCPVTLLGDHMQLPPICELKKEDYIQNGYLTCCLWEIPMYYCEDVFSHSLHQLYEAFAKMEPPKFDSLVRTSLNVTYRFGNRLASILSQTVYTDMDPEFKSGLEKDTTEIYLLDTPKTGRNQKRENIAEAQAIRTYLNTFKPKDVSVLTPYRAQKNLLTDQLRGVLGAENIMTVHSAQGQEWDTVLFSVSDSANENIFFIDSNNVNGKTVVNTAISRAKKELVLVCDATSWQHKKDQLITALMNAKTEIDTVAYATLSKQNQSH